MKLLQITLLLFALSAGAFAQEPLKAIAVLQLDYAGITEQEADILTRKLSSELVKLGSYTVLDRSEMATILQEQGFQQSGCSSQECAVEVGQLLGVQMMIAGSVGKIGSIYYTEIRMLDVETSQITQTVDHSQTGAIEDVLLTSMPYVAAKLSGADIVEQIIISEILVEDTVPEIDTTPAVDTTHIEPEVTTIQERQITLVSHHRGAKIYMNGELLGVNRVTIPVTSAPVMLQERMIRYESKPEEVNLSSYEKDEIGVGGKAKEAYISFGYAVTSTEKYSHPGFKMSIGGIKQSSIAMGFTFIVGQLNGLGAFTDTPDSYWGDNGLEIPDEPSVVTLGGFYEFRYEWDIARILKWGVGVDVGFMANQHQSLEPVYLQSTSRLEVIRSDINSYRFGGPQVKVALGYKKVFFEFTTHLQMGQEVHRYYTANSNEWVNVEDVDYNNEEYFSVNPMVAASLLLVL